MKAKTMKKALSLFLAVLMIALAIPFTLLTVSAATGDLLGTVDFSGSNFIDGRGEHWNKTNASVSDEGKTVTVEYTDIKRNSGDENRGRARYGSNKMSDYKTAGKSYTVQFTIESAAYVGVMLDGNTGFIINPSLNTTSVGQTNVMDNMPFETYNGTGSSKQTYAIEMTCAAETSKSYDGKLDVYAPTVYRLFVKDEINNNWRLVREITDAAELSRFEFEAGGYDYFYFAVTRYSQDECNFDSFGNSVKSTVSNVEIYSGIDFITKGEPCTITTPVKSIEPVYTVNFNGDSTYNPIDGRDKWYKTNATPSDSGNSVTVEYTTEARTGVTVTEERARFCSTAMTAFPVNGKSYTVEFTIDSKADVGFMLDGNTGFVINPSLNRTSIGQTAWRSALADYEVYDGTGESKQTYAIELECASTTSKNYGGNDAYFPTVYKLYVQQENGTWKLIRELPYSKAEKFEWEDGYAYFYLSINRYGADENNVDSEGNPVKSTVSDVKIYEGIGFIPAIGLETGASVRLDTPTGLRFTGVLGKHYVDGLRKTYGEENVTIGMLITPTDYLNGIEFTKEALDNSAALANYEYKYLEIDATTILTKGNNYEVNCTIVNIQEANYNRAFSAILYIKITDGDTVSYSYSSYNAEYNSRSVAYVASLASSDMKETQSGDYQYSVEDVYGKTMYSPYNDDQRTLLENFSKAVTSFTVMTYNINIDATNSENVLNTVKDAAPDIVGFQEDSNNWKNILPALNDFGYNNVGGESNNDEYLDIYYNSSKFTEVSDGALYYKNLKNTYSDVPLNGADLSLDQDSFSDYKGRYLRYVVLKDASGTEILVVNTHLHRGDNSAEDRLLREYQARLLKAWLDDMAAQYPNQIVLGDINDTPSENSIIELTKDGALSQARRSAFLKVDVGGTLADAEGRKTYALDHVIYRVENMSALEYSVIDNAYNGTYPSDHLPVMAKFVCCTK